MRTNLISLLDIKYVLTDGLVSDSATPDGHEAGDVVDGRAGGTSSLWFITSRGSVVGIADVDGPFCPIPVRGGSFRDLDGDPVEGEVVDVAGISVALYASEGDYLKGNEPVTPLFVLPLVNTQASFHVAHRMISRMIMDYSPIVCGGCRQVINVGAHGELECGGEGEGSCSWITGETVVEVDGALIEVRIPADHPRALAAAASYELARGEL